MSTATFTPIQGRRPRGATATTVTRQRHGVGDVFRAAKVFAAAAVSVVGGGGGGPGGRGGGAPRQPARPAAPPRPP
ncbi:hypothetical protein ACFXCR_36100, partial [Streptomyces sp. NPDC059431]|uniref:hypothetical protein n=1 Tax=Streptomyces sp. NPDC059431 TaxID=3346828 RepID=UPI003679509E